ncbi:MAG: cupin domain-containing protein [Alphaproteobacteria bacterium]|nr:cupin domain-containing protein [Alphaproteobacteria bacterium]
MSYSVEDLLRLPGEGEQVADMNVKARASDLGGDFSIMEGRIAPYQLLTPHTHQREDQAVFVIEGELEFEVGGEGGLRFSAPAGSYVIKPRGVQHGFWNAKETPVRYIELSGRANFERFVDDTDESAVKASRSAEEKYEITFHYDRIPVLMARHKLTSLAAMHMPTEGMKPPSLGRG